MRDSCGGLRPTQTAPRRAPQGIREAAPVKARRRWTRAAAHTLAAMPARFELFADGACSGNPGPGAWAFILRGGGIDGEIATAGFEPSTTNNRMELLGIIRGIESIPAEGADVAIVSDSEYAVKGLTEWLDGWKQRGWKNSRREPVKNDDLWKRLDALRSRHRLTVSWVRGHEDHPENNRCDRMAVKEIERHVAGNGDGR